MITGDSRWLKIQEREIKVKWGIGNKVRKDWEFNQRWMRNFHDFDIQTKIVKYGQYVEELPGSKISSFSIEPESFVWALKIILLSLEASLLILWLGAPVIKLLILL